VPEHELKRRNHSWEPAWSPTMAGGLFAIDKVEKNQSFNMKLNQNSNEQKD
jgi:hypothetical protein